MAGRTAFTFAYVCSFIVLLHQVNAALALDHAELLKAAKGEEAWVIARRRDLHKIPELMYQEEKTSAYIRKTLDGLGIKYQYPLAKTGLTAKIGSGERPIIALRSDIDALPIEEGVNVEYKSTHPGRMHACGHDAHMSMLLGAAKLLKAREAELKGTVLLIFQPAEEGGAGAERMLREGIFKNEKPDITFGMHVWPTQPTGTVGLRAGSIMGAAGLWRAKLIGKGGHGAMPHLTVDPIVAASAVVTSLQHVVSRKTDPLESAVVSVTLFQGGTALNVIPPEVTIGGTWRSLTKKGHAMLREEIHHVIATQAAVHGCTASVDFLDSHHPVYPPTVNDKTAFSHAAKTATKLLGKEKVLEVAPSMTGEDFSFFLEEVPGCMMWLGINNATAGSTSGLHTPQFQMDESMLHVGVAMHVSLVFDFVESAASFVGHQEL